MNHQGLFWNVHCSATVVTRKQLNFKSAVIRSKRSSCLPSMILVSTDFFVYATTTRSYFPEGSSVLFPEKAEKS